MEIFTNLSLPFLFLLSLMAFMYASVGHGGASGYLAVLALFSVDPALMKSSALILNIFVSAISFYHFYSNGYFKWKLFYPFAIASIPAAYFGAQLPIHGDFYKKILGVCLLVSVVRLSGLLPNPKSATRELKLTYGLIAGGIIGFLSGMLGIGGGIILSPVILLFHWAEMKETAAVSALFIFVNSVSGLFAIILQGFVPNPQVWMWLAAAIAGGTLGAWLGSTRFNTRGLRYILSAVLVVAAIKLLLG